MWTSQMTSVYGLGRTFILKRKAMFVKSVPEVKVIHKPSKFDRNRIHLRNVMTS